MGKEQKLEPVAYKIFHAHEWAQFEREGVFHGSAVDLADGFIHLSARAQVSGTLQAHFAGAKGLVLAAIDLAALGDAVRWEPARGGILFPHVYGVLTRAVVLEVEALAGTRWPGDGARQ
jgi:beta-hydroxylase